MKACLTIHNHWLSSYKHIKYIKFKKFAKTIKQQILKRNVMSTTFSQLIQKKQQLTTYDLLWKRCEYSSFYKEKCYIHNIFTTLSQQIINDRLLLVVMDEQKSNLSCRFKLEPITINHLWFVMKMLWKRCRHSSSHLKPIYLIIKKINKKI